MELPDLSERELVVFVALAKLVIRVDNQVSDDERAWLTATAEVVGAARWREAIATADATCRRAADVRAAAEAMERPEARAIVLDALLALAGSDDYLDEEAHILDWLARTWAIGDHVPTRR